MNQNISIIGGDLRIVKLAELLEAENFKVAIYAMDEAESINKLNSIKKCDTIQECIKQAEVIVGPVPLSSNGIDINTPFSDKKITVKELIPLLTGKTFIAGAIKSEVLKLAEENGVTVIDLMAREELAVLNTISTAEGAIQIAMEETPRTIHGSNVLVMGFGRVGKILSNMLNGIGAHVYCEARKDTDLAWIKAYGYHAISLKDLDKELEKFDVIINTIPAVVLNEEKLQQLKKECLLIDLASHPGGVDKQAAKKLGIKLIWALSLPGKVAPITSAEFIKETLINILKDIETKA